jgi:flagellar motor switch protein FliN/FliY
MNVGQIKDVKVPIMVVIGTTEISLEELSELGPGSIIALKQIAGEPIDLYASGEKVAQGEVVVIDENFGIRVTQILDKKGE